MDLLVFFKILGSLEGFTTHFTIMRLQRGMNSQVTGDVVALYADCFTILPVTAKGEVASGFTANVAIAQMTIEGLWIRKEFRAGWFLPLALELVHSGGAVE